MTTTQIPAIVTGTQIGNYQGVRRIIGSAADLILGTTIEIAEDAGRMVTITAIVDTKGERVACDFEYATTARRDYVAGPTPQWGQDDQDNESYWARNGARRP